MAKNYDFETLLEEGFENISQHFYDEEVETNADFRANSGIKAIIKRTMVGETCPWCEELEGVYEYGKHPKDIFRRHRNCDCVVEYITEKERTNVHTKQVFKRARETRIRYNNQSFSIFASAKSKEILEKQPKVDEEDYERVIGELKRKGVAIERSEEWNKYLDLYGMEGIVFADLDGNSIIYHTNLSYSGMYEEIVHLKQIEDGKRANPGTIENYLLEIEAKEELIRNADKYKISDYEISVLKEYIRKYKILLEKHK